MRLFIVVFLLLQSQVAWANLDKCVSRYEEGEALGFNSDGVSLLDYCSNYLEIVYQVIAAESASEGQVGMDAVAVVIVNRANGDINKLEKVVTKPLQFSCLNSPPLFYRWLAKHYTPNVRLMAYNALKRALGGEDRPRWTHYHTIDVRPYWARGHKGVRIGHHVFYEGIK